MPLHASGKRQPRDKQVLSTPSDTETGSSVTESTQTVSSVPSEASTVSTATRHARPLGKLERLLLREAKPNPHWAEHPFFGRAGATAVTCLLIVGQAKEELGFESAAVVLAICFAAIVTFNGDHIRKMMADFNEEEMRRREALERQRDEEEYDDESTEYETESSSYLEEEDEDEDENSELSESVTDRDSYVDMVSLASSERDESGERRSRRPRKDQRKTRMRAGRSPTTIL